MIFKFPNHHPEISELRLLLSLLISKNDILI